MKLFRFVIVVVFVFIANVQGIEDLDATEKLRQQDHEGDLTDDFAVELDHNDEEKAREIAELHGFDYAGRIGSLPGHFHMIRRTHQGDDKRGEIPYPKLSEHPNVKWHEQQRELTLEKRNTFLTFGDLFGSSDSDKKQDKSGLNFYHDPMYTKQWYINNVGQVPGIPAGRDMGIYKAWKMGYTGKGVVVTVMDDGLDHTNKDLKKNFDPKASKDVNDNDGDPQPRDEPDQYHGTKCSGEIAAAPEDGFCGVGIAPNVNIGAVRMLDGKVTGITEGKAFSLEPDYIDIYSASWGPKDNGQTLAGPSTMGKKALELGVVKGRNGKGSIYVWASGNGGAYGDDCGCDGYASSIYTIAIGSVGPHGKGTYYDEKCAATMAVVYSGDDSQGQSKPLVTTARGENGCIEHFGGTSAAAPLAVGVFSLVLQANKDLTWRDMQHIITKTARKDKLEKHDGIWKTNAAGFKVSSKFGFGLLYAPDMINAAKEWKTVAPQRKCVVNAQIKRGEFLKRDGEIVMTLKSDACEGTGNHIAKLEHVQVVITLKHRHRGVLSINIESPQKTNSQLLSIRPRDESKDGVIDWPFMSVQFWGENPAGEWKLTIKDNSKITQKRMRVLRRQSLMLDEGDSLERSVQQDGNENDYPEEDDSEENDLQEREMPFRHEVELDESENEAESQGDYKRGENYNIFDVRSDFYGELKSWSLVQYGTGE